MNKSERQLNLVFLLLNSNRGVTRQRIRESITDYLDATSEASFERMFERDKQDIKELGFQIDVVQEDFAGSDEILYKIDKSISFLNFEHFSLAERLLLQVARNAISASNRRHHPAVLKIESDSELLEIDFKFNDIQLSETILEIIMKAIAERRRISFEYQGLSDRLNSKRRNVTPIRMVIRDGVIYLVTFCHDRKDYRAFRTERIMDLPEMGDVDQAIYSLEKISELEQFLESQERFGEYLLQLKLGARLFGVLPKGIVISELDDMTKIEFFQSAHDELIEFIAFNLPSIEFIHSPDLIDSLRMHFRDANHV